MSLSLAAVAQLCRYAAALRILDRASMEQWAMDALDDRGTPAVLAEIVTSTRLDSSALALLLEEVPGERDDAGAAGALLGGIATAYLDDRIGIRRACGVAWELACAAPLGARVRHEIDMLDDGIALADLGTFVHEDVERDARAFFATWMTEAEGLPVALSFE